MKKKIFIFFLIIFSFFWYLKITSAADQEEVKASICDKDPTNVYCKGFTVDTSTFSPGSKKILNKAREWWWDTKKSAQAILDVILKDLIVVFGSMSLIIITIGWGMMIFHSGSENILSRWKWMLKWWLASLAIGLSAGLIIKLLAFILY